MLPPGWPAAGQPQAPTPIAINKPVGMTQEQQVTESAVNQLGAGVLSLQERITRLETFAGHATPTITNLEIRLKALGISTEGISDAMSKI